MAEIPVSSAADADAALRWIHHLEVQPSDRREDTPPADRATDHLLTDVRRWLATESARTREREREQE
jgi:hypothetical protein